MSLRDTNLRYAALKLIADIVDKAMKDEKADHLEALQAAAEDTGAKSWEVTLGGRKVAGVTLSQRSGGFKVGDPESFAVYVQDQDPKAVDTVVTVKDWKSKELLDRVVDVVDGYGITSDGDMIPGVVEVPAGAPYQSLRWDSKADGREAVAEAIRHGELREILAGTGLPMIEQ